MLMRRYCFASGDVQRAALIDVCYDRSGQVQAAGGCMAAS